jgi:hypothetical protein
VSAGKRPSARELLEQGTGVLGRSHLRELGWERRAVDAIFRACPTVKLPGYSRECVKVEDYLALIEQRTFGRDRVTPT